MLREAFLRRPGGLGLRHQPPGAFCQDYYPSEEVEACATGASDQGQDRPGEDFQADDLSLRCRVGDLQLEAGHRPGLHCAMALVQAMPAREHAVDHREAGTCHHSSPPESCENPSRKHDFVRANGRCRGACGIGQEESQDEVSAAAVPEQPLQPQACSGH